jgi:phosphate transport system substrate-binding protein
MKQFFSIKKAGFVVLTTAIVLVSACGGGEKSSGEEAKEVNGTITISGAFALYPLVNVWAEEFRKKYPDVKFNISGGGAGKGMADLLGGLLIWPCILKTLVLLKRAKVLMVFR